jgi:MerR family transcriptional regulator, light-induced transcriptional regulator
MLHGQLHRLEQARSAPASGPDVRGALSQAIRNIVLPRLVAARNARDLALATYGRSITEQDISSLLAHVTTADQSIAEAMLTVLRLRGVPREDILLDLFQPVAQRLGDRWLSDQCSFADVTLGVGCLQRLMRSPAMPRTAPKSTVRHARILIACMPGEQHTFGAAVIDDLFRSAGWDTLQWAGQNPAILETVAAASPCDIIGISVGERMLLGELAPLAARLRRGGLARGTMLIAGGHAFDAENARPADYGVDAIVHDPRAAVRTAEALLRDIK